MDRFQYKLGTRYWSNKSEKNWRTANQWRNWNCSHRI